MKTFHSQMCKCRYVELLNGTRRIEKEIGIWIGNLPNIFRTDIFKKISE